MIFLLRGLLLLAVAPMLLADSNSNAVNERIPVRKQEIEAHWKLDCASSWAAAIELRRPPHHENCSLPADLQRQLQLCAFIYQPPGEQATHTGPDYLAAISREGEGGQCHKLSGADSKK